MVVCVAAMLFAWSGNLDAQTLPRHGDDIHLGVGTCAGSTCHASATPWRNSSVQQSEYLTWRQRDRHAKAYQSLLGERGRLIAANLGLPNAHEAKVCLDCHADNVPAARRGRGFELTDGVGCESCHGGASRWLGVHVSGTNTRAQNLEAGMYPLDDPAARGRLCMTCHLGTADPALGHRILGAGHPRLRFELDTYTAVQPAHFRPDADYRQRKRLTGPVTTWMVGQAVAADLDLQGLADPKRNPPGLFPELAFFDCQACHHSIGALRFERRPGGASEPGVPRLRDAHLVMMLTVARSLQPALAERLGADIAALHRAVGSDRDSLVAAVGSARDTVRDFLAWAARSFSTDEILRLADALCALGQTPGYRSFAVAEQTTMALGGALAALREAGGIDAARHKLAAAALDEVHKTVNRDDSYSPAEFGTALAALEKTLAAR